MNGRDGGPVKEKGTRRWIQLDDEADLLDAMVARSGGGRQHSAVVKQALRLYAQTNPLFVGLVSKHGEKTLRRGRAAPTSRKRPASLGAGRSSG